MRRPSRSRSNPHVPERAVGVGGSGFPVDSPVAIGFDDGSRPFLTVTSNDVGSFLAVATLPARLRVGDRRLVASSSGGAVAAAPITIEGRTVRNVPMLPGYGLG